MGRKTVKRRIRGKAWTKQLNRHIDDLSDGRGINISTTIYVSKYTGKLVLYDGIRCGLSREGRTSVDLGEGLSPEDKVKYQVGRENRSKLTKGDRVDSPSSFC